MVIGYTLMLCGSKTTYANVVAMRQEHNDNTDHKSTKCFKES